MIADLYDYDGTICPGDTGSAFYLYCLARRPYILIFLPFQLLGGLCYKLHILDSFSRRCSIHCYMRAINAPRLAERFAKKRVQKTFAYFLRRDQSRPAVVCSASPAFLLQPICAQLGVAHLIATDVDPHTGRIRTPVCKGARKVEFLHRALPDTVYARVYSDSLRHDAPILRLGTQAFLVRRGTVRELQNLDKA